MLVLSRKQGETVCIGHNIRVTVLGLRGNVLKLGIDAPRGVRILRSELQPSGPLVPSWPK
jgi:carbon storage regulator